MEVGFNFLRKIGRKMDGGEVLINIGSVVVLACASESMHSWWPYLSDIGCFLE